jgi:hypothetical protein
MVLWSVKAIPFNPWPNACFIIVFGSFTAQEEYYCVDVNQIY